MTDPARIAALEWLLSELVGSVIEGAPNPPAAADAMGQHALATMHAMRAAALESNEVERLAFAADVSDAISSLCDRAMQAAKRNLQASVVV